MMAMFRDDYDDLVEERQVSRELREQLLAKTEQWRGLIRALNECENFFQAIADQPGDQSDARIATFGLRAIEKAKMEFCQ